MLGGTIRRLRGPVSGRVDLSHRLSTCSGKTALLQSFASSRVRDPMKTITGPGSAFELLFDESGPGGRALPPELQQIYGGDWRVPDNETYVYTNFAVSRDGRVSFDEPGHLSGGDVSGFNTHDRWLMALLRARAD